MGKNRHMKKFAFLSDVLFSFFVSFLFTLFLFRYMRITLPLAFTLALLCGGLTASAVGAILQTRRKNLYLKKSDEAQKEKLMLHLAILSDEQKTKLFAELLSAKRFGKLKLYTDERFYALRFSLAPVNADEVLAYSRLKTGKPKTILCAKIEESAYKLCQKLGIQVQAGDEVYALFKEKNALPKAYLGEESTEKKYGRRVRLWFSRANAKGFLACAALLLLTALISPFPYYYFVFGGLFLVASVLIRIFGYE
jgi:hypothetical protein